MIITLPCHEISALLTCSYDSVSIRVVNNFKHEGSINKFAFKKETLKSATCAVLDADLGSPSSITHRKRISSASNKTRQIIYPKF